MYAQLLQNAGLIAVTTLIAIMETAKSEHARVAACRLVLQMAAKETADRGPRTGDRQPVAGLPKGGWGQVATEDRRAPDAATELPAREAADAACTAAANPAPEPEAAAGTEPQEGCLPEAASAAPDGSPEAAVEAERLDRDPTPAARSSVPAPIHPVQPPSGRPAPIPWLTATRDTPKGTPLLGTKLVVGENCYVDDIGRIVEYPSLPKR